MTTNLKNILITGASSGIGAALAIAYAAPAVTLHLGGRHRERLDTVTAECAAKGAHALPRCQDVRDRSAMADWVRSAWQTAPLDLVIANAGISGGTANAARDGGETDSHTAENEAQVRDIMATNIDGVINTVLPAYDLMSTAAAGPSGRRGQIAVMSSLAGFRGFPGAPAYCASKAAVRSFGEGLRGLAMRDGIGVSVICPGFVESPMTDANPFPMPFIMSSERAATIIQRGLARNRGRISFPHRLAAIVWLMSAVPPSWTDRFLARLPGKPASLA